MLKQKSPRSAHHSLPARPRRTLVTASQSAHATGSVAGRIRRRFAATRPGRSSGCGSLPRA